MPTNITNCGKKPIIQYLYKSGLEFSELTGGWINGTAKGDGIVYQVSEKLASSLHQRMQGSGNSIYISKPQRPANMINLTDFNKLKIRSFSVGGNQARSGIAISTNQDVYTGVASFYDSANNPNYIWFPQHATAGIESISECDISSFNGLYYIILSTLAGNGENREFYVKEIWLEV